MRWRWLLIVGLSASLMSILIITEIFNIKDKPNRSGMNWHLIEADGTYYWKDPTVFIAMMITLAILVVSTFKWLKIAQKRKLCFLPLILIYLASPLIQSAMVEAYVFVYCKTFPGAHMNLNYSIDWASPADKAITFLAPSLIALLLGIRGWKGMAKDK